LDIPFSVCHALPPFFIRAWDYPNKHFSFSGKGPENLKNRKRVLACCACYVTVFLLTRRFQSPKLPAKITSLEEKAKKEAALCSSR